MVMMTLLLNVRSFYIEAVTYYSRSECHRRYSKTHKFFQLSYYMDRTNHIIDIDIVDLPIICSYDSFFEEGNLRK